jgi:integrase
MSKFNAKNERLKREYVLYLEEAKRRDPGTVDRVLKSITRFEESTRRKDFKSFHRQQAVAFKKRLSEALNARTGERLSKATVHSILRDLHAFFFWLAHLPGYKSHVGYLDADYFNLSDKDVAIANARREKRVPTLAQVELALSSMPASSPLERRNRAVLAFAVVTGARAAALASFRLGDINMNESFVDQDARHVRTKFSKSFRTFLMPVSDLAMAVAKDWHTELSADPSRGPDDALFPATAMTLGQDGGFTSHGLALKGWSTTDPVRDIFRRAFTAAGLSYFNPHSIRDMLVRHIMTLDLPLETLKSWSQNLGHEGLLTTITSYGSVPTHRQGELIKQGLPKPRCADRVTPDPKFVAAVIQMIQEGTGGSAMGG